MSCSLPTGTNYVWMMVSNSDPVQYPITVEDKPTVSIRMLPQITPSEIKFEYTVNNFADTKEWYYVVPKKVGAAHDIYPDGDSTVCGNLLKQNSDRNSLQVLACPGLVELQEYQLRISVQKKDDSKVAQEREYSFTVPLSLQPGVVKDSVKSEFLPTKDGISLNFTMVNHRDDANVYFAVVEQDPTAEALRELATSGAACSGVLQQSATVQGETAGCHLAGGSKSKYQLVFAVDEDGNGGGLRKMGWRSAVIVPPTSLQITDASATTEGGLANFSFAYPGTSRKYYYTIQEIITSDANDVTSPPSNVCSGNAMQFAGAQTDVELKCQSGSLYGGRTYNLYIAYQSKPSESDITLSNLREVNIVKYATSNERVSLQFTNSLTVSMDVSNPPEEMHAVYCVKEQGVLLTSSLQVVAAALDTNECNCQGVKSLTSGASVEVVMNCNTPLVPGTAYTVHLKVDGGHSVEDWRPISLGPVLLAEPAATVTPVATTLTQTGITLTVDVEEKQTNGMIYAQIYQSDPDNSAQSAGGICRAEVPQIPTDGFSLQNIRVTCTLQQGKTYYWKVSIDRDGAGAGLQYVGYAQFQVDPKLDYNCRIGELATVQGCWDTRFTCISCCNSQVGLPTEPGESTRNCWIENTFVNLANCCGDPTKQTLEAEISQKNAQGAPRDGRRKLDEIISKRYLN